MPDHRPEYTPCDLGEEFQGQSLFGVSRIEAGTKHTVCVWSGIKSQIIFFDVCKPRENIPPICIICASAVTGDPKRTDDVKSV